MGVFLFRGSYHKRSNNLYDPQDAFNIIKKIQRR